MKRETLFSYSPSLWGHSIYYRGHNVLQILQVTYVIKQFRMSYKYKDHNFTCHKVKIDTIFKNKMGRIILLCTDRILTLRIWLIIDGDI